MTPTKNQLVDTDRIDREAADWVVRWGDAERSPTLKEQSRWFGWLRRSPRHVQSYFDTAELFEKLGKMDSEHRIDVDEWLTQRRASVTPIAPDRPASMLAAVRPTPARRRPWALAALAASLLVCVFAWNIHTQGGEQYRTTVGQQSTHRLPDGSVINLNTRSRATVRFSEQQRLIELEGEALFTVARDAGRPFYVRTKGATIRAVGTKFNVYEQAGETKVAVVEGIVQVSLGTRLDMTPISQARTPAQSASSRSVGPASVALSAGEAARIADGRIEKRTLPDPAIAVAWQFQQLVFEDASLSEVVAQFNRYNAGQIHVEGAVGESKRLSGTFNAVHPQSLLLYLAKDPRLSVQRAGEDYWIVVRPSSPAH